MPDSNMITRRIANGRRIVVATPAYLQRHGTPKSPGELTNHEAIIYTRGGGQSWTFRKGAAEVPVVLQGRLKVTQAEGLREAVNHDMGLAVALEWVFSPELKSGKVVEIFKDWALPPTNLSAVYPTGRLASTKARALVSFVAGIMGGLDSASLPRKRVQEGAARHTPRILSDR